ncbi:MAG: hypothetical protein V4647_04355 [Pseudomonadota bacterium]
MKRASAALLKSFAWAGLAISPIAATFAAAIYFPVYETFFARGSAYPVRVQLIELPAIWPRAPGDASAQILLHQQETPVGDLALAQPLPTSTGVMPGMPLAALAPDPSPETRAPSMTAATASPPANGIMPVNFDIAGPGDMDDTLQISKTVTFNERPLGQLTVRIEEGARVYVSTAEMSGLFPEGLRPPRSWQEFVPLRQVRDAGIDLRYDPTSDQLVLRDSGSN